MQLYNFANNQLVRLTSDQLTSMVEGHNPQLYETIDYLGSITINGDIIEGLFSDLIVLARHLLIAKNFVGLDEPTIARQPDNFILKEVFGDHIITEVNVL